MTVSFIERVEVENEINLDLDKIEDLLGDLTYDWDNLSGNEHLLNAMEYDLNEMKNRVEKTLLDLKKFKNLWEKSNG